jgi:hypothetical protein
VKAGLPDDGRLRFNGYGKGVLEWETDDEAVLAAAAGRQRRRPVLVHGLGKSASASATCMATTCRGCVPARARRRLSRPIWMDVELGWPFTESAQQGGRRILPAEARSAVWHRSSPARGDHLLRPQLRARHAREHDPGRRVPGHEGDDESVNAQITALPQCSTPRRSSPVGRRGPGQPRW